jgi:general secretion pathway protein A
MEYYQYFCLKGPPFQPASPDGAVYLSPTHMEGLATLESGLSGELTGLTMLTGEAGSGKTTLIYSLLQRDYKRVRVALIEDPKLSFLEMMQVVLRQMNLYSTGTSKLDYLETFDRLLKLRGKEERIAIIVDESQLLSDDVLEELRLLSNRSDRCLQLVLVGHPELAERLKKPELRQLNQRISSRGVLEPLTPAQAIKYVECKLSAQGSSCAGVFERGALKRLLRRSDGIPRKINMLCHSAMQAAYNAAERKVSYKTANRIAAEYYDSVKITKPGFFAQPLVMPAMGIALAALMLVGWGFLHTVSSSAASKRMVRPVGTVKRVGQVKPLEQAKSVEQVNSATQPGVQGRPDSGAEPQAATPLAPHAPAAVAPAGPNSNVAGPATAPEMRKVPTGPTGSAAAAGSSATQQQAGVSPALDQRSQIVVKDGDTLEKIALRFFRSNAGVSELIKANPQLTDINHLSVGQVIYLPPGISGRFKRI